MTNQEKAVLSLVGIGVLAGTFRTSARKAGWSAGAIGLLFLAATHPDEIKKVLR